MQNSPFKKLLLALLLTAMSTAVLLQLINPGVKPTEKAPPKISKSDSGYHYTPPQLRVSTNPVGVESESDVVVRPKLPRDEAEAWLAKHNRNAMGLLAVFRATGDTNYLNEAATNFPNDPHVELAVLACDEFPADRRKWLDLFKIFSPSNSLANYLSAQDDFKNGKKDEAIQELVTAAGKGEFQNYWLETALNAEELYLDSGKSRQEIASFVMSDTAEETLPQLADYRRISQGISEAMKNDPASAAELSQLGLTFADKINSGDSGKLLVNQMVGIAIEKSILAQLAPDTAYDFLNGQTPAQVLETFGQQKADLRKLMVDGGPAQMQMMASESETASYMQRVKIYGEIEAMKWLIQQHPPANPPK